MMAYPGDRRENGLWGSYPETQARRDKVCCPDDVRAVAKTDEPTDAARASMAERDAHAVRTYLEFASDMARTNLVCPEVQAELACALMAEDHIEASADCLECGLLSRDHEDLSRRQDAVCTRAAFGSHREGPSRSSALGTTKRLIQGGDASGIDL